jgi:hypothetical protein
VSAERPVECEHLWLHLREVRFKNIAGTWGDEFFCCRCLDKKQVKR